MVSELAVTIISEPCLIKKEKKVSLYPVMDTAGAGFPKQNILLQWENKLMLSWEIKNTKMSAV